MDAAHLGRGEDDHVRALAGHEIAHGRLIRQVELCMGGADEVDVLSRSLACLEPAQDRAAHHAAMASYVYFQHLLAFG